MREAHLDKKEEGVPPAVQMQVETDWQDQGAEEKKQKKKVHKNSHLN
jgi:hypothetical protein